MTRKKLLSVIMNPDEKEKSPWKRGLLPVQGGVEPIELHFNSHSVLDWNHDGTEIYFARHTKTLSNIWIYSIENRNSRKLTDFKENRIKFLDVSPDGNKIAISRGRSNSDIIQITRF